MAYSLKIYYFWRIRHTHWHFWRVGARFKQGKDLEDQLLSELLVNFTLQTITKLKMSWGPGTQSYIHVLVRASYSRHRCYKKKKIKNMVILHLSLSFQRPVMSFPWEVVNQTTKVHPPHRLSPQPRGEVLVWKKLPAICQRKTAFKYYVVCAGLELVIWVVSEAKLRKNEAVRVPICPSQILQ